MQQITMDITERLQQCVADGMKEQAAAIIEEILSGYDIRKRMELTAVRNENGKLLNEYLQTKISEGCADGTVGNYGLIITHFFNWCRKDITEITTQDLREFLTCYYKNHEISLQSLDKYREILTWFFGWCHAEGKILMNPAKTLKPIRHETRERKAMSRIELEIFRDACKDIRERAIVEFLYSTACRVSELCTVKKSDVNFRNQSVRIFGKGRKERTSWLNAKCVLTLYQYLDTRKDDSEYLFVNTRKPYGRVHKESVEKMFHAIQERAEREISFRVTPHILRHTSATHALESGMDVQEIQRFLGHARIDTTMRYAHVSVEDVAVAHRKHVV